MAYVPRTENEIRQSLIARVLAYTSLTDLHEGGVALEMIYGFAKELARAYWDLQLLAALVSIDRATGSDLEDRAAEVLPDGQLRQAAHKAQATVRFSRSPADMVGAILVPAGQVVAREDGVAYATTADETIPDGILSSPGVTAVAQQAGSAGNTGVSTIIVLRSPPARVVSVTNSTTATGGQDQESDESLRNRIRQAARALARCNPEAIKQIVLAYINAVGQQVRFLKLIKNPPRADLWIDDGTGALDTFETVLAGAVLIENAPAGETVIFLPRTAVRTPPATLLQTPVAGPAVVLVNGTDYVVEHAWGQVTLVAPLVAGDTVTTGGDFTAFTGLVADVQQVIDGNPDDPVSQPGCAAAGTAVRVVPATGVLVPIAVDVLFSPGVDVDAVITDLKSAVVTMVNALDVAQPLFIAKIIDVVMSVAGVMNVTVSAPAADTYPAVNQVLRTTDALVTVS